MSYLYETHLHTSEVSRCGRSTAKEQILAYKERGYTGVIVTDHFVNGWCNCPLDLPWNEKMVFMVTGYEEAKKEGDKIGLDVFLGWEYFDNGSDYLTYGLGFDFLIAHPELMSLTIEEYSPLVRKYGGFLAQAHPYRISQPTENYLPAEAHLLDAIEVYNATKPEEMNLKAFEYAKLHNIPMISGSDSHSEKLKFASGIKLAKKAESIFDIINAVKLRQAELILPEESAYVL